MHLNVVSKILVVDAREMLQSYSTSVLALPTLGPAPKLALSDAHMIQWVLAVRDVGDLALATGCP